MTSDRDYWYDVWVSRLLHRWESNASAERMVDLMTKDERGQCDTGSYDHAVLIIASGIFGDRYAKPSGSYVDGTTLRRRLYECIDRVYEFAAAAGAELPVERN